MNNETSKIDNDLIVECPGCKGDTGGQGQEIVFTWRGERISEYICEQCHFVMTMGGRFAESGRRIREAAFLATLQLHAR